MKKLPTNREILRQIYDQYYKSFGEFKKNQELVPRATKIYVPIDVVKIAKRLNVDPDIVFGRLYYHLDKKYAYERLDGSKVHLFALKAGADHHVVNFPLLSAVLSDLEEAKNRYTRVTAISVLALFVSAISLIASFLR
ncbi:MAG: hypothetical protein COA82_08185 [Alkaliphilus sp.]|nr:MAG: hypothetical protein COA82_08185 [Alkaliphilus sp.]